MTRTSTCVGPSFFFEWRTNDPSVRFAPIGHSQGYPELPGTWSLAGVGMSWISSHRLSAGFTPVVTCRHWPRPNPAFALPSKPVGRTARYLRALRALSPIPSRACVGPTPLPVLPKDHDSRLGAFLIDLFSF